MWLHAWGLPTVSYHAAKFGSHRYCASVDMFFSFVTWQNHVIKRSYDFEGGVPHCKLSICQFWWSWALRKGWYKALHLPHDHVIKRSHNLVDAVTLTMSSPILRKMQYSQSQYQFQFQCLEITNIQPKPCAFESCSFCKSIQNKDQILISKFIFCWPYI